MREVPDCGIGLCDTPRQNASGWFSSIIEARKALPNQLSAVTHAGTATWRSGYAAVCKTVYPGSIPGVASSKIKHLASRRKSGADCVSVSSVDTMPQQVGRCIFCGGRGLTKEHVWPKWLRGILDPSITSRHFYSTSGFGRRRTYTHRAGSIESRRMRIVCERCNTGWMSRLQNNARSRLLPLIRGQYISLTEADHKILAAWSMMFTMVIEFFDPMTLATPQRERMDFSRIPAPNDTWMVWFGMADDFPWAFHHYGWRLDRDVDLTKPPSVVLPRSTSQSTAIRVGKLLVLTYSTRAPSYDLDPTVYAVKHGLHLIWPLPAPGLNASPLRRLTKGEVIEVTWQFMGRIDPQHPKPTWPSQPDRRPLTRIGRGYSPLIE
jgi:hypothetical protein